MQTIKRFAIYWFDPEPTIGSELRKIRPCIVVSPEEMIDALHTVLIIPLTSTSKSWPFRVKVSVSGRESSAACDQLRAVDKSRLKQHIGNLSPTDAEAVVRVLQEIFA